MTLGKTILDNNGVAWILDKNKFLYTLTIPFKTRLVLVCLACFSL